MMDDFDREIIDDGLADLFECAATDRFGVDEFKRRVWALFAGELCASDELRQLREFVVAVGGIWEPNGTRSKLVGENSLAESINRDSRIAEESVSIADTAPVLRCNDCGGFDIEQVPETMKPAESEFDRGYKRGYADGERDHEWDAKPGIADTAGAKQEPVARVVYGVDVDGDAYARAEWLTNALENGTLLYLAAPPAPSVADAYRQALEEIVKNDPFNQSSAGVIARAAIAKESGNG